jgi:hypothetical protein
MLPPCHLPPLQPQPHLRFQLTEQVALARREWPLQIKAVTATVKAEAAYWLQVSRGAAAAALLGEQRGRGCCTAAAAGDADIQLQRLGALLQQPCNHLLAAMLGTVGKLPCQRPQPAALPQQRQQQK